MEKTQIPQNRRLDQKLWYYYTVEFYSAIEKDKTIICNNMDGARNNRVSRNKPELQCM